MIENSGRSGVYRRKRRWAAGLCLTLLCVALLAGVAGCGDPDPYGPHGVPYRGERYSSQNGRYRSEGGSQDTWAPFSNGHSEYQQYDDGHGNGMTYSHSSNSSHFP